MEQTRHTENIYNEDQHILERVLHESTHYKKYVTVAINNTMCIATIINTY